MKKKQHELNLLQFTLMVVAVAAAINLIGLVLINRNYRSVSLFNNFVKNSIHQKSEENTEENVYNSNKNHNLTYDKNLQNIVDDVVILTMNKDLPKDSLSITLIDINNTKKTYVSGYNQQTMRFPASVAKLFWMVAFYKKVYEQKLPKELYYTEIYKMIQKSDNNAASKIVDELTETTSGSFLESEQYGIWLFKRQSVNRFFQKAGYTDINISQKNFPIPTLKLELPEGCDLQMRGDPSHPIRNKMTTDQAARLMYEIVIEQAISKKYSQEMKQLLMRDLRPETWKKEQYNSIEGFLGESLPGDSIYFASKVGWTSSSRQEVAFIESKDGTAKYILVVFGDHPAYAEDWDIFPQISLMVFNQMMERGLK